MFSDIWNKIKELVRNMLPKKTVEDVLDDFVKLNIPLPEGNLGNEKYVSSP